MPCLSVSEDWTFLNSGRTIGANGAGLRFYARGLQLSTGFSTPLLIGNDLSAKIEAGPREPVIEYMSESRPDLPTERHVITTG